MISSTGLDLSFIGALSSSRSSMMRYQKLGIDAAITREWVAQQMVCLSPLNNEVRRRATRGYFRSRSRTSSASRSP